MNVITQYWTLWCLSPSNDRLRYQSKSLPTAQAFCTQRNNASRNIASDDPDKKALSDLQTNLLQLFHRSEADSTETEGIDPTVAETLLQSAQAGLCLRCYVSHPILKACQKIDSLFAGNKSFSYRDLMPFVLNDDGRKLVVLDGEKTQRVVDGQRRLQLAGYKLFSVEVLKSYQGQSSGSMSLANWTFLRTKQHPELKTFLSEFGFQQFSDWTLINRIQVNQKARLSERDRQLVEVFHQVYRRDRRLRGTFARCQTPADSQLIEMNQRLKQIDKKQIDKNQERSSAVAFSSSAELLSALKQIAQQLRQFDIWQAREPLEVQNIETGDYALRTDIPAETTDEEEIEEAEFITFLHQQSDVALTIAIEQAIQSRLEKLKKSKRYAPFAESYVPGLLRYYQEGISLKDIGSQLGMNNWDQTRRILNPGDLLSQVRLRTHQQLLSLTLEKAQDKGLVANPPDPNQLKQLMEGMDSFLDSQYFSAAAAELKSGRNRSLESDYAQRLLQYLTSIAS